MAVGFGYVRDEEPAIVDWASITREARASIKQIEEDRQKKREGVEEAMREQSKLLLNKPTSQNSQYNKAMANLVAQLEATSLDNYKALRRGDIKLSDFNSVKNTLFSETQGILAIAKTYAENFDANILASQNGTNSGFANWTNSITQEYMDFQGVSTIVDPTGKISFVKTLPDGTTQQLDTSELFSLATNNQAAYNYSGNITKALEEVQMKTFKSDVGGQVQGYFIDPLTGKVDQDVLDKTAEGIVQQDYAVYSILHDFKGGYDFEKLPSSFYTENDTREAQFKALDELQKNNPNKIYVGTNGQPIVTSTLRDAALEYVKQDLDQYKITATQADPYRAKEIVNLDIGWREATIAKVEKEAAQVGEASKVPALKAYTKGFFDFTKKDEEGNIIPGEVVENIEDVLQQGLGKFNFRQISYDKNDEILTFYPVQGGQPFVLDLKIEGKTPDELAEDLSLIVLNNRGLKPVIQQAIIDGALTDVTPTGEKPSVDYTKL